MPIYSWAEIERKGWKAGGGWERERIAQEERQRGGIKGM